MSRIAVTKRSEPPIRDPLLEHEGNSLHAPAPKIPPIWNGQAVTELGEIKVELRNHEASLAANHSAIGDLRERTAAHDTAIKVVTTEHRETREDISQISKQLEAGNREFNLKLSAVQRSFYTAAVAMLTMMLSICGLIAVLLSNHT